MHVNTLWKEVIYLISINPLDNKPIYEQIIESIKEGMIRGIINPGEKLLSVRKLSSELSINPNTVQKAYSELERQNVIVTVKGRGTYVSQDYKPEINKRKLNFLKKDLKNLVVNFHYHGITKDKFIDIVDEIYGELEGD